jgi:hypothetical protein
MEVFRYDTKVFRYDMEVFRYDMKVFRYAVRNAVVANNLGEEFICLA